MTLMDKLAQQKSTTLVIVYHLGVTYSAFPQVHLESQDSDLLNAEVVRETYDKDSDVLWVSVK